MLRAANNYFKMNNVSDEYILNSTRKWIEKFVIGLGLCPFARHPFIEERVRFVVCNASDWSEIKDAMLKEAKRLLASTNQEIETTLLICPSAPERFESFLDLSYVLEDAFFELGYEGILQIATFHPLYRFHDSLANDPADYTNRSPFPVFHLLREESVSIAVDSYPDIEEVPKRNCHLLRSMGMDEILLLLKDLNQ